MRVASSMYYNNIFSPNKTKISDALFNVNKQISSGLRIEYAKDDVAVFSDTMRLDNEIATLEQAQNSTNNAMKMATQTDKTLNDVQTTLDRMKVLMVNAGNASHSGNSLDAIYRELLGLRDHLKNLANTSINGQYLFSGSALDTKPIDENGRYRGNDQALKAFAGSNIQIQYNITGAELFLGEESQTKRRVTTNVKNLNQTLLYPDIMKDISIPREQAEERYVTINDTIRDLMGDIDTDDTNDPISHFYIRGQKHDGTNFEKQIDMESSQTIEELLSAIEDAYGRGTVDVSLNPHGQIEITDKLEGSSKLKFNMIGAVDFDLDGNGVDDADLNATGGTIEALENTKVYTKAFIDSTYTSYTSNVTSLRDMYDESSFSITGEMVLKSDFSKASLTTQLDEIYPSNVDHIAISGTATDGTAVNYNFAIAGASVSDLLASLEANFDLDNSLEFRLDNGKIRFYSDNVTSRSNIDINLETQDSTNAAVKGIAMDSYMAYDTVKFSKKGNTLQSNVAQIVTADNSFATRSTKLSEVADLSQGTPGTLDGTTYNLTGIDVNGNRYTATINLASAGSTFSVDTDNDGVVDTTYTIYNVDDPRSAVDADEMTYGQLMDVVNMIVTDSLPANSPGSDAEYDFAVDVADAKGSVTLSYDGKITFEEKGKTTTQAEITLADAATPPTLSFVLNDALTISDPKTDFFKQIDEAIEAVGLMRYRPDASDDTPRNVGIQNGIQIIDDMGEHVMKVHAKIGALTNSLDNSMQRSQMLSLSAKTLQSSVIDTDLAEASLQLNQLTLNYQAILSTVGRVSQLSLVNYL